MVHAPGFFTLTGALVRIAWSRSVAVMFSRSPSASIRKFDRIGMVVLRSTTLCVAVSSFTSSWRLTVISIAAPCATACSTVSTIDTDPPPPFSALTTGNPAAVLHPKKAKTTSRGPQFVLATLYNSLRPHGNRHDRIRLDCIHLDNKSSAVEIMDGSLD